MSAALPKSLKSIRTVEKACAEKSGDKPKGFPLRILREEKGISRSWLARKLGLWRSHLERLESRAIERLTIADLEKICQGLECRLEEVLQRFYTKEKMPVMERSKLDMSSYSIHYNDGVKICSLARREKPYFAGVLKIQPQKEWTKESVIARKEIFIHILQGNMLLKIDGKEHLFRENESLTLSMPFSYEIYNPHQFKELAAMIYVSEFHPTPRI